MRELDWVDGGIDFVGPRSNRVPRAFDRVGHGGLGVEGKGTGMAFWSFYFII